MVFEVSATAAETQTRVEALVSQITATLLSGTNIAQCNSIQFCCVFVLFCFVYPDLLLLLLSWCFQPHIISYPPCIALPSLPFPAYPTCSISIPLGKNEITPQVTSGLGQGSEEATSADKEAAFNYTRSRAMDRWPACFYLKLSYLNSLPYSPFLFRFVLLCFFVSANPICSASLYCTVLCCVVLYWHYCTVLHWDGQYRGKGRDQRISPILRYQR